MAVNAQAVRPPHDFQQRQTAIVGAPPEVKFTSDVRKLALGILPESERRRADAQEIPHIEKCVVLHNLVTLHMDVDSKARLQIDNAIDDLRGGYVKARDWMKEIGLPEGISEYDLNRAVFALSEGKGEGSAFVRLLGEPIPDSKIILRGAETSLHALLKQTAARMADADHAVFARHGIPENLSVFVYRSYGNPNADGKVEHSVRDILRTEARRNPTPGGTSLMIAGGSEPLIYAWAGEGNKGVWADVITHEYGHIIGMLYAPLDVFRAEIFAEGVNLLRKWGEGASREELTAHYQERTGSMERRGEHLYKELHGCMLKIVEKSETAEQAQELLRLAVFGEDSAGRMLSEANHISMIHDFLDGKTSLELPARGPEPLAEETGISPTNGGVLKKALAWVRELRERLLQEKEA